MFTLPISLPTDGSAVTLPIAFLAGLLAFFASCLVPLVPTYLAYLSGVSLQKDDQESDASNSEAAYTLRKRVRIVQTATGFVLGFILTFILLALAIKPLTSVASTYKLIGKKVGGIFLIVMGLLIMGVWQPAALMKERRFTLPLFLKPGTWVHAFLTGATFGFGWSPCIGPVLAVILYWSSEQATMLQGVLMLVAFGVGLGLPFLLIAVAFERVLPLLKKYRRITNMTQIISGVVIVLAGAWALFK